MPRARNPNRDKAYKIWKKSGKKKRLKEIAAELGVPEIRVRKWKCEDKWERYETERSETMKRNVPERETLQLRLVENNVVNLGGAPENNLNALKHGLYAKIFKLTTEEEEYLSELTSQPLDGRLDLVYGVAAIKLKRVVETEGAHNAEMDALNLMRRATTDKHKIAYDNARLELEREKVSGRQEETMQTNFIEALNEKGEESWEDGDDWQE